MPVRTPPRPGPSVGLRDQRGANALIARYIRELSTRERPDRHAQHDAPRAVTHRG
jgi:hypothetical protein